MTAGFILHLSFMTLRTAVLSDAQHGLQVFGNTLRIDQQRRSGKLIVLGDAVPGRGGRRGHEATSPEDADGTTSSLDERFPSSEKCGGCVVNVLLSRSPAQAEADGASGDFRR